MSEILRICLTGPMRSGKDTVARHLNLRHDFEFPVAFGDALKLIAHKTFPDVPREPKPRALYQFMNVMRDYDPDVWIKHVSRTVSLLEDSKTTRGIVITDARQANEIEWARANGFTIVRVTTPMDVRIVRAQAVGDVFDYEDLTHPTELEVAGFDVDAELSNVGDLDALKANVDALVAKLKGDDAK
ncbi:AAA family ATPase [Sporosarcina sp. SAFN-015]|uniref:AAA family ATPase n=1 Tax=Sporosarcina sp. SAFN-015 TaxID=3387274 RepID=UPI003F80EAA5